MTALRVSTSKVPSASFSQVQESMRESSSLVIDFYHGLLAFRVGNRYSMKIGMDRLRGAIRHPIFGATSTTTIDW